MRMSSSRASSSSVDGARRARTHSVAIASARSMTGYPGDSVVSVPSKVISARKNVLSSGGRLIPKVKNSWSRSLNIAALGTMPGAR